jgi:sugar lactone lactonase YvrE
MVLLILSFDRQCNLYVVDSWNHRIQKFEIDSNQNNLFK